MVIEFEHFKNEKKLEQEYLKFLSYTKKYFKDYSEPEIFKRMFFITRYIEGTINAFNMILIARGASKFEDNKRGIRYLIQFLESIIQDLKSCI